jgi:hypothetical protein
LLTTDKYSAVFTEYSVAEYSADHYSAEYSADRIVGRSLSLIHAVYILVPSGIPIPIPRDFEIPNPNRRIPFNLAKTFFWSLKDTRYMEYIWAPNQSKYIPSLVKFAHPDSISALRRQRGKLNIFVVLFDFETSSIS